LDQPYDEIERSRGFPRLAAIGHSADPGARLRDIAVSVGITERTAAHIVKDLELAGYLTKTRDGRRNRYEVHGDLPLRHPGHRHRTVGDLIGFLEPGAGSRTSHS
jgi:hypothetical protein